MMLPDTVCDITEKVKNVVKDVMGENNSDVTKSKRGIFTIPWPTRDNQPVSEFTTVNFFTLAFPTLFPYATGDFHINRPKPVTMSDWAEHLMWFSDGRFAQHPYFKFILHNIIARKRAIDQGNYIVRQQLGDPHLTVADLKQKLQEGDTSLGSKIVYFSNTLRGSSQYWAQRGKEQRALENFQINQGHGLPSFFTTGSCAEYHFKPLRRLLTIYLKQTSGEDLDPNDKNTYFQILQKNNHIVAKYFDLRTLSYFKHVMVPLFGVNSYWYRQEFAKSRGMVHWHGLCWCKDREPHNLMYEALKDGLSDEICAEKLAKWATDKFGMTASHPAGSDVFICIWMYLCECMFIHVHLILYFI